MLATSKYDISAGIMNTDSYPDLLQPGEIAPHDLTQFYINFLKINFWGQIKMI